MTQRTCTLPMPTSRTGQLPYAIRRRGRYWQVVDAAGELVCLTVHKRGAQEVVRRLAAGQPPLSPCLASRVV
jgi:hypothetical protein